MSLQLLVGYSSGEEEPAVGASADRSASSAISSDASSDESDQEIEQQTRNNRNFYRSDPAKPPPDPSLPSALDTFAEVLYSPRVTFGVEWFRVLVV